MFCAVLFSPGAGQRGLFAHIGQKLQQLFGVDNLITCPGGFGGDYLPKTEVCKVQAGGGYVENINTMTRALMERRPEILITVGGDGIASYIADAMLCTGKAVPIMGIAAGTANVGPLVRLTVEQLDRVDITRWNHHAVSAVEVLAPEHLGYAVNDVVIGNTLLGTVDGQVVNLSAAAMALEGKKEICAPTSQITGPDFRVVKNGRVCGHGIAKPAQILATTLDEDRLEGRAIYGCLCSAAYCDCKGALALTREVMICAEAEDAGMQDFCPVEHLLFGPGDEVRLEGLTENAHAILDGNPYVHGSSAVTLRYLPGLITVATPEMIGG